MNRKSLIKPIAAIVLIAAVLALAFVCFGGTRQLGFWEASGLEPDSVSSVILAEDAGDTELSPEDSRSVLNALGQLGCRRVPFANIIQDGYARLILCTAGGERLDLIASADRLLLNPLTPKGSVRVYEITQNPESLMNCPALKIGA